MSGYISLHRQIKDNWMWTEKREFSKLEAWLDILLSVNHKEAEVVIKFKVYKVKRGESIKSLDSWAKSWNWNKSKVRRFLKLLEEQGNITLKNETQTTRITVCKYDSYQTNGNASETQVKRKRNASETQLTPNNNENKNNNENNSNIDFDLLINFYNDTFGRTTRTISSKAKKQIKDRMKEGYTKKDLQQALLNAKNDSYHIETNFIYITLEFISRPDKFERFSQSHTHNVKPKMI